MGHGMMEGCKEGRKEGGKEGNNMHGAWKECGKKKERGKKKHNIISSFLSLFPSIPKNFIPFTPSPFIILSTSFLPSSILFYFSSFLPTFPPHLIIPSMLLPFFQYLLASFFPKSVPSFVS